MLDNIKIIIKKNRIARELNSAIKGFLLDVEYIFQIIKYKDNIIYEKELSFFQDIPLNISNKRPKELSRKNSDSRLNIFFVGTYFDHEMQGFYQGLQKIGDVHIYINSLGLYGLNKPKNKTFSLEENLTWGLHLYESILKVNKEKPIDFVIGTFTAPNIDLKILNSIKCLGIPIVNYAMDDMLPMHWRIRRGVRMGSFGLGPAVTLSLQTTPKFIPRYYKEGYPTIYLPFASDPNIFSPREDRSIDVLFIGNCYGKREALVRKCLDAGINIIAFGEGFPRGHVPGSQVPELFGKSKIILGSGLVGHSSKLCTLKLRDFDAPMSGGLYLTSHNDLLSKHFVIGDEIETYFNVDDCIKKIKFYLANENERLRIAKNGRKRCEVEHTWGHRLKIIPDLLNLA